MSAPGFEWEKHGAAVLTAITRPINYGDPSAPREKGIDVRLAIDFVMMAMRDEYDVGIIFSGDTDLLPALEAVIELKGRGSVEVAAWVPGGSGHARPLKVKGEDVWCHFLDRADYGRLHDPLTTRGRSSARRGDRRPTETDRQVARP